MTYTHTRTVIPRLGLRHPDRSRAVMPLTLTGIVPPHPPQADYLSAVAEWNGETNFTYGTCVVPDTRVLTADLRWVRAGDLSAGDHLLGFDEVATGRGRSYRRSVVESVECVHKPCYDLVFEDGTHVRCSDDHRWLTDRGHWCTTRDLICGPTRRTRILKPLDMWDTDDSRDGGYLAGALDGEGCLIQRGSGRQLIFAQAENPMLAEVERCLKQSGFTWHHTLQQRPGQRELYRLAIYRTTDLLRFLGTTRPARLLARFNPDRLGLMGARAVRLASKTAAGVQEVVKLETSSRTYLAAGFASHNCGPVSVANSAIAAWWWCTGQKITVSDGAIFDLYRASGNPDFDPNDPGGPGDAGVDMTVMLAALLRVGLKITHTGGGTETVKPICFARVTFGPYDDLHATTSIFGGMTLAALLDVAQQDQTDAGLWDYVAGSDIWGGHAFHGGAYTSATDLHRLDVSQVTWTQVCGTTPGFINHQLEDVFVLVWEPVWYHDAFQQGVDQVAMAADFTAVTGRPWPGPAPEPSPLEPSSFAAEWHAGVGGGVQAWCRQVRTRPDLVTLKAQLQRAALGEGLPL